MEKGVLSTLFVLNAFGTIDKKVNEAPWWHYSSTHQQGATLAQYIHGCMVSLRGWLKRDWCDSIMVAVLVGERHGFF